MYSRTDKIRYFNALRKPSAAQKDYELLKKNNPSLSRLARYGRNPDRYADDILYDLLDCCTAEDIEANRGNSTDTIPEQEHVETPSGSSETTPVDGAEDEDAKKK